MKTKSVFSLAERIFLKKSAVYLGITCVPLFFFGVLCFKYNCLVAFNVVLFLFALGILSLIDVWAIKRKTHLMRRRDRISKLSIILDLFGIAYRFIFPFLAFWGIVEMLQRFISQSIIT